MIALAERLAGVKLWCCHVNHKERVGVHMMRLLSGQSRGWLCAAGVMLGLSVASSGLAATKVVPLTEDEQTWLVTMREEEKLARDLYSTFYTTWKLKTFLNTAKSEQTHMNAVGRLLKRYGVEDPVVDNTVGVFDNPDVQDLFDTLAAQGNQSLAAALQVGAQVEQADIEDLTAAIAATTHRDVVSGYKGLLSASKTHLKTFAKNVTKYAQSAAVGATTCPCGSTCGGVTSCVASCTDSCSGKGTCTCAAGTCGGGANCAASCTGTCSGKGSCGGSGSCSGSGSCARGGSGSCSGAGSCSGSGSCGGSCRAK